MKPDFFWVGQGKAGSSLTFRVLARHPEVFLGEEKEHNVFRRPVNRQVALDHYQAAARNRAEGQLFGDISPSYYDRPVRINRIANFYRDGNLPKILFCLRHPLSFAVSRYHQILKVGKFLDNGEPYPGDIDSFVCEKLLGEMTAVQKLRHVVETLGGPDNICLLTYEDDFNGSYEFEPKIHRALGIASDTRYYDTQKDAHSNSGLRPWFDLTAANSAGAAASFCSAPNRSRVIASPSRDQIAQMQRANEDWQRPLSASVRDRIQSTLTQPLRAYVKSTFGQTLGSWDIPPPLPSYPAAPPLDAAAALT